MPKFRIVGFALVVAVGGTAIGVFAQMPALAPRSVPARSLPVPTTVSPGMQQLIAAPLRQNWDTPPTTPDGWKAMAAAGLAAAQPNVAAMRDRLHLTIAPGRMAGVKVFTITPEVIAPENRNRLVLQVHGGCYVLNPAEAGLPEAMLMAAFGQYKVIAVDYRMPPEDRDHRQFRRRRPRTRDGVARQARWTAVAGGDRGGYAYV